MPFVTDYFAIDDISAHAAAEDTGELSPFRLFFIDVYADFLDVIDY